MKVQEVTFCSLPMFFSAWRISYPNTENVKHHVRTVLFAYPELTSTLINQRKETPLYTTYLEYINYITLEKQLPQDKRQQNRYQESQQLNLERQLNILQKIQKKHQELQKFQQLRQQNYIDLKYNLQSQDRIQDFLKLYQERQQELQEQEKLIQNQIQTHRTKTSKLFQ